MPAEPGTETGPKPAWNITKHITEQPARGYLRISVQALAQGCCRQSLCHRCTHQPRVSTMLTCAPRPGEAIPHQHARDSGKARRSLRRPTLSSCRWGAECTWGLLQSPCWALAEGRLKKLASSSHLEKAGPIKWEMAKL